MKYYLCQDGYFENGIKKAKLGWVSVRYEENSYRLITSGTWGWDLGKERLTLASRMLVKNPINGELEVHGAPSPKNLKHYIEGCSVRARTEDGVIFEKTGDGFDFGVSEKFYPTIVDGEPTFDVEKCVKRLIDAEKELREKYKEWKIKTLLQFDNIEL